MQLGSRFMNLGTFSGYDAAGNPTQDFQGGDQMIYFGTSRRSTPSGHAARKASSEAAT